MSIIERADKMLIAQSLFLICKNWHVVIVCWILQCCPCVYGYETYQARIPNGNSVPHPCRLGVMWPGVGHRTPEGTTLRNQFGLDYQNNMWSVLCAMDSDGDGMTNGEELGDPSCNWVRGGTPTRTVNITHPGICEPMDSDHCTGRNDWVDCEGDAWNCPAIDDEATLSTTFRFPPTPVPAQVTTLICMTFNLPNDTDYHIVATVPFINNTNILHHIGLQGCENAVSSMDQFIIPGECNMASCSTNLGIWTQGMPGQCMHPEVGIPFGVNGSKSIMMQLHWDNPTLRDDILDSSGMTLYYTAKKRQYDSKQLRLGQIHIEVPPNADDVMVEGTCSVHCTNMIFKQPIHIIDSFNHMHYLGKSAYIEHFRDGIRLKEFGKDDEYVYQIPTMYSYDTPIEVRPGDELKLTCHFHSTRKEYTYYGPGAADEMCFSAISFFSDQADVPMFVSCTQSQKADICDLYSNDANGCQLAIFMDENHTETSAAFDNVTARCRFAAECNNDCASAVDEFRKHPCMQGNMNSFAKEVLLSQNKGLRVLNAIQACDNKDAMITIEDLENASIITNNAPRVTFNFIGLLALVVTHYIFGYRLH